MSDRHPRTAASKYSVAIYESERGWGSKIDSVEYFDTLEQAEAYRKAFNADNTATAVPDWYMTALEPKELP